MTVMIPSEHISYRKLGVAYRIPSVVILRTMFTVYPTSKSAPDNRLLVLFGLVLCRKESPKYRRDIDVVVSLEDQVRQRPGLRPMETGHGMDGDLARHPKSDTSLALAKPESNRTASDHIKPALSVTC